MAAATAAALPAWNARSFLQGCTAGNLQWVQLATRPEHMAARSGVDLNTTAYLGYTGIARACERGDIEMVRYLTSSAMLAAGIDVNKAINCGDSPLALAAEKGHVDVVQHLLESPDLVAAGISVDVNAANCLGYTALHWACKSHHSPGPEVVALLLRQPQLDIYARDRKGRTALQLARASTEPGSDGAQKAALIREAIGQRRKAPLYVLLVAVRSRREGRVAAPAVDRARAGAGAGTASAEPAVPAGTLDEEDEEARARRRLMGSLPRAVLGTVCALVGGGTA